MIVRLLSTSMWPRVLLFKSRSAIVQSCRYPGHRSPQTWPDGSCYIWVGSGDISSSKNRTPHQRRPEASHLIAPLYIECELALAASCKWAMHCVSLEALYVVCFSNDNVQIPQPLIIWPSLSAAEATIEGGYWQQMSQITRELDWPEASCNQATSTPRTSLPVARHSR